MDRDELQERLIPLIGMCPGGLDNCPLRQGCTCGQDVATAMALIDEYTTHRVEEATTGNTGEAWDASKVAEYLGYRDEAAARAVMSRWGIKKVRDLQDVHTNRMKALYPANKVRAEAIRRGRR